MSNLAMLKILILLRKVTSVTIVEQEATKIIYAGNQTDNVYFTFIKTTNNKWRVV